MGTIYEKCAKVRDDNKPGTKKYEHDNQVLLKLMGIAFQNTEKPDTLPKRFSLYHVKMGGDKLDILFKKLGIDAEIRLIDQDNFSGHIYGITINDIKS